jgi:hypothetical protein
MSDADWIGETESLLKRLAARIEVLEKAGLQDSQEYEDLSDEYQSLGVEWSMVKILGD